MLILPMGVAPSEAVVESAATGAPSSQTSWRPALPLMRTWSSSSCHEPRDTGEARIVDPDSGLVLKSFPALLTPIDRITPPPRLSIAISRTGVEFDSTLHGSRSYSPGYVLASLVYACAGRP